MSTRPAARIPPTAVVRPTRGLCNRLRGIVATQAMARRHGLPFAMVWGPGWSFSSDAWEDLFANALPRWSEARLEEALAGGLPRISDWARDLGRRHVFTLGRRIRRHGFFYDDGYDQPLDARFPRLLKRWRGRRADRLAFLRALRPAPALAEQIDAFETVHFAGQAPVGVHIRRGDGLGDPERRHLYMSSSDQAFLRAMEARGSDARFFLATDCEATERRFREHFGERVVVREKVFVPSEFGAPKEGQRDAVVELFLLSRTREILGNRGSSFCTTAARMGGIPIERVQGA